MTLALVRAVYRAATAYADACKSHILDCNPIATESTNSDAIVKNALCNGAKALSWSSRAAQQVNFRIPQPQQQI